MGVLWGLVIQCLKSTLKIKIPSQLLNIIIKAEPR